MTEKIEGKLAHHLTPAPSPFPQSRPIKVEIAILFSTVEKFNSYAFEDNMNLHSPWGKGCSL